MITTLSSYLFLVTFAYAEFKESLLFVDPQTNCPSPTPNNPECPFQTVYSALDSINFFEEDANNEKQSIVRLFLKEGNDFYIPNISKNINTYLLFEICAYRKSERTCEDYERLQSDLPSIILFENSSYTLINVNFRVFNLKFNLFQYRASAGRSLFYFEGHTVTVCCSFFVNGKVTGLWEDNISLFRAIDCGLWIGDNYFTNNSFSNINFFYSSSKIKPNIFVFKQKFKSNTLESLNFSYRYSIHFSGNSLTKNTLEKFNFIRVQEFEGGVFLNNNRFTNNVGNSSRFPLIKFLNIIELQLKNNILDFLEVFSNDQVITSLMQIMLVHSVRLINTTIEGIRPEKQGFCKILEFLFDKIFNLTLENTTYYKDCPYLLIKNINEISIINTMIKNDDSQNSLSELPFLHVNGYNNMRIYKFFVINYKNFQSLFDITVSNNNAFLYPTSGNTELTGLFFSNIFGEITIKVFRGHSIRISNSTFREFFFEKNVFDLLLLNTNLSFSNCIFEKTDFPKSRSSSLNAPVNFKGTLTDICLTNLIVENIFVDQAAIDLPDYFLYFEVSCKTKYILIRNVNMANLVNGKGGGGLLSFKCQSDCPKSLRLLDCKLMHRINGDYYSGLNFIYIEGFENMIEMRANLEINRFQFENIFERDIKGLNTQSVKNLIFLKYSEVKIFNIYTKKSVIAAFESLIYLESSYVTVKSIIMKIASFLIQSHIFHIDYRSSYFIQISDCEFSFPRFNISTRNDDAEQSIFKLSLTGDYYLNEQIQFQMENIFYYGNPFSSPNKLAARIHFIWIDSKNYAYSPNLSEIFLKNSLFLDLMCVDGCIFYLPSSGNFSVFNCSFINILATGKGAVALSNDSLFTIENSFFKNIIGAQGDFIYFYYLEYYLVLINNTFVYDFRSTNPINPSGLFFYNKSTAFDINTYATDCNYQFQNGESYVNVTIDCYHNGIKFCSKFSKDNDSKFGFFHHKLIENLTSVMIPMNDGQARTQFFFENPYVYTSRYLEMHLFNYHMSDTCNTFILDTDLYSRKNFNFIMFGYANEFNNGYWDYSEYVNKNNKNSLGNVFVFVTINLKICKAGEYNIDTKCGKCSSNTYSMSGWRECQQCPSTAKCSDGVLSTKPGFWRSGSDSNKIYFCYSNPAACLGDSGRQFKTDCLWGYTGVLCKACDKSIGFVNSGTNECGKCRDTLIQQAFIFALMFFIFLLFEFYLTFAEATEINNLSLELFEFNYESKKEPSVYLNTLLTHYQLLNLIQFISFNFPQELKQISAFFADSSSQIFYSHYCLLYQIYPEGNLVFMNFGLIMACAFIRLLSLIIFWLLFIVFKLKRAKKSQILLVLAIWGKIEFVTIFREWLLLSCDEGPGVSYIKKDSNYICTSTYKTQFYERIFPIVTSLVILIPVVLLLILVKNRKVLGSKKYIELLGSLYLGTKLNAFYWNTIIFLFKLAVIFFGIFGQGDSGQAYELFILFFLYGFISYLLKPYNRGALNSLNEWSACIYLLTISFMLIKNVDSINKVMRYATNSTISPEIIDILLTILIYVTNFSFLLFLGISIMIQYSEKLRVKFKRLKLRYYTFRHQQAEKKRQKNRKPDSIGYRNIKEPLLIPIDCKQRNQKLFFSVNDGHFKEDYIKKSTKSLGGRPHEIRNEKNIRSIDECKSQCDSIKVSEILFED